MPNPASDGGIGVPKVVVRLRRFNLKKRWPCFGQQPNWCLKWTEFLNFSDFRHFKLQTSLTLPSNSTNQPLKEQKKKGSNYKDGKALLIDLYLAAFHCGSLCSGSDSLKI